MNSSSFDAQHDLAHVTPSVDKLDALPIAVIDRLIGANKIQVTAFYGHSVSND